MMNRLILSEEKMTPEAQKSISTFYLSTVQEVMKAVQDHQVVVVGMKQNPVVKKARKVLSEHKISYHYLEYGSYFSEWKRRLAIKLWSGWPTYPQIFIDGKLIGGCDDLIKFLAEKKAK